MQSYDTVTAYEWDKSEDLIDVAVVKDQIYVLDLASREISLLEREKQDKSTFNKIAFWSLKEYEISSHSRIAVFYDENSNFRKVYITLANGNEIFGFRNI